MNSYFAKLALRAAAGNAATRFAVPTPTKAGDPFEEVSARVPTSRPESERPAQRIEAVDFGFSTPQTKVPIEAIPSMETSRPEQQPDRGPGEFPTRGERETIEKAPQQITKPIPPLLSHQVLQRDNSEPGMRTSTLAPPIVEAVGSSEAVPPLFPEQAPVLKRLTNLEDEQEILLRKADAFMGSLLERRKAAFPEPESEPENVPTSPDLLRSSPAKPIHPHPAVLPVRLQDDADQPSLVIGKLTVEVVPAAPTPRVQPVVVANKARSRNVAFPSSRRFGLGQF